MLNSNYLKMGLNAKIVPLEDNDFFSSLKKNYLLKKISFQFQ